MTPAYPILYSFRRCPYAMRGRMALSAAGIECELREVALRDKPPEMLEASAKGTVPILVLPDGTVLEESLVIMEWALGRHDPHEWTSVPRDAMTAWIERIDGAFKHHLDRYKYPNRYDDADPLIHRNRALVILEEMERAISVGGHLVGRAESLCDIAAFPFVRQFAHTDKSWFDAQELPALQAWLDRHLSSVRFNEIMSKHEVWKGGVGPLVFSADTRHKPPLAQSDDPGQESRVGV